MKKVSALVIVAAALALVGIGAAEAHGSHGGGWHGGGGSGVRHGGPPSGGHWHGGRFRPFVGGAVFIGAFGYPYYAYPGYYYPAYGYPPAPAPYYPPVTGYVEQPSAAAPQGDWFYCPQSRAYYPQVQECPGGWQRIPPQPAPQPPN